MPNWPYCALAWLSLASAAWGSTESTGRTAIGNTEPTKPAAWKSTEPAASYNFIATPTSIVESVEYQTSKSLRLKITNNGAAAAKIALRMTEANSSQKKTAFVEREGDRKFEKSMKLSAKSVAASAKAMASVSGRTQIIVGFKSPEAGDGRRLVEVESVRKLLDAATLELATDEVHALDAVGVAVVAFGDSVDEATIARATQSLLLHEQVEFVEPDRKIVYEGFKVPFDPKLMSRAAKSILNQTFPNDPDFGSQWGFASAQVADAWALLDEFKETLKPTVVSIADTGIDFTHPDLLKNVWINQKEMDGKPGRDDDRNGYVDDVYGPNVQNLDGNVLDDDSHGSHCAGTIAATTNNKMGVAGLGVKSLVQPCKFLGEGGTGTTSGAIECVDYAISTGAKIISASWGFNEPSEALYRAIDRARQNNILFVCSAGNDGANTDEVPHYPSCFDLENIIAVAAHDIDNNLGDFSNYGAKSVDISAPGVSILSTVVGGGDNWYSGTSMATPFVAGTAALMLSVNPSLTPIDIVQRIQASSTPVESLKDKVAWGSLLNTGKALEMSTTTFWVAPEQGWLQAASPVEVAAGASLEINVILRGTRVQTFSGTIEVVDDSENLILQLPVSNAVKNTPKLDESVLPTEPVSIPSEIGVLSTPAFLQLRNRGGSDLLVKMTLEYDQKQIVTDMTNAVVQVGAGKESVFQLQCNATVLPQTMKVTLESQEGLEAAVVKRQLTYVCEQYKVSLKVHQSNLEIIPSNGMSASPMVAYSVFVPQNFDPSGFEDFSAVFPSETDENSMGVVKYVDISKLVHNGAYRVSQLDGHDDGTATLKLQKFLFHYYGLTYSEVTIGTNGLMSPIPWGVSDYSAELTSNMLPNGVIAPFWVDLSLANPDASVWLFEDESRLVVQWSNVSVYGVDWARLSFQAQVTATGDIYFAYQQPTDVSFNNIQASAIHIGVESPDGSRRTILANTNFTYDYTNPGYVHAQYASASSKTGGVAEFGEEGVYSQPTNVIGHALQPLIFTGDVKISVLVGNGWDPHSPAIVADVASISSSR